MQKIAFILCFSLALSIHLFANKIDDLKTDADVNRFIQSIPELSKYQLITPEKFYRIHFNYFDADSKQCYMRIADSMNIQSWMKADFDKNGKTDLLLNLIRDTIEYQYPFGWYVIMDEGDSFSLKLIPETFSNDNQRPYLMQVKDIQNTPCIIYYDGWPSCFSEKQKNEVEQRRKYRRDITDNYPKVDTLILTNGHFIEYEADISKHNISEINLIMHGGYGVPFTIEITINKNLAAYYDTISGMNYKKRHAPETASISKSQFAELNLIFNHVLKVKAPPRPDAYDCGTFALTVAYDDSQVYKVEDYCCRGNYALIALYDEIDKIMEEHNWRW